LHLSHTRPSHYIVTDKIEKQISDSDLSFLITLKENLINENINIIEPVFFRTESGDMKLKYPIELFYEYCSELHQSNVKIIDSFINS
jgi:hypothetical protein